MMPNEKDAWEDVERKLSSPYGRAWFVTADGHLVAAETFVYKMRLEIMMFIDGQWHAASTMPSMSLEEIPVLVRRVYRTSSRYVAPAKWRTPAMRKAIKAAKLSIDPDRRICQSGLPWRSPKACISHLRRNNPGIRPITQEEYKILLDASENAGQAGEL